MAYRIRSRGLELWIECPINLGSKLKKGYLNLLQNEKKPQSTRRNIINIARVRSAIKQSLKKKDRSRKQIEFQKSQMKKDETAVQDTEIYLKDFKT